MSSRIILATGSEIRAELLANAGVKFDVIAAGVDEHSIRNAMINDHIGPQDIADALADAKARKISIANAGSLVIGFDQILHFDAEIFSKPADIPDAIAQLSRLSGRQHSLFSAAVVYLDGTPQWRHVGRVDLHMRSPSSAYLADYVNRNWASIRHSVGCYLLEAEGIRLFSHIDGDYFTVLGIPLVRLLDYLTERGALPG